MGVIARFAIYTIFLLLQRPKSAPFTLDEGKARRYNKE